MDLKLICVKQSTGGLRPMRPVYAYRVDPLEDKGKIFVETDALLVGVFRLGNAF